MTRINKALDPATAQGEYIGLTLIEPAAARRARRRAAGDVRARPAALLRGRLPGVRRPRRARRRRADRRRRLGGGRRPPRPRARAGDRLPLLTRMIGAPLHVDIGPGTVAQLAPLLADRRISAGGHVAVVVGPGPRRGDRRDAAPRARRTPTFWTLDGGGVAEANELAKRLRGGFYDALVGIGGGRTLDVAKLASTLSGPADGRGGHEPRPRRDRLAGRVAGGGRAQGLLRRPDADRARRRPRLRAPLGAADAALGDRRRDLQPRPRSPTGGSPGASAASRSTGSRSCSRRPPRSRSCTARTGSTTRTSSSRSPRRSCSAGSRWRPRARAARAAAATTRSCTRSTTSSPARARHGELAGAATLFTVPPARRRQDGRRGRRLPDAPRAAAPARATSA